jgi:hypothetical protein
MSRHGRKKKQRTEVQHFVPQFILRGFTNASGQMWCYDKLADKSHPTSTAAAAQERYFYEIPPGSFKNVNVPVNAVENALSAIEGAVAPLHAELIRSADFGFVPATFTVDYAPFLVLQWMRTRTHRDTMREMTQKMMQSICDDAVKLNFPPEIVKKANPRVIVEEMVAMHAQRMFDPELVKRMARDLERHLWIFGINKTEHPFYTSDHPVVRRANLYQGGIPLVGVCDPGVEFAFPLDSRHILLILERTHFAAWRQFDNRSVELSVEQVHDYNSLQVMRSNQRVFCADNDFDLAREVCAAHPEIRDPNRARVSVETTPMKDMKSFLIATALE